MSPSVTSIIRLTIRIAVVLPQPDGPTSTQISPAGTSSERPSTAGSVWPGYRFVTFRSSSVAAAGRGDVPGDWADSEVFTVEMAPERSGNATCAARYAAGAFAKP